MLGALGAGHQVGDHAVDVAALVQDLIGRLGDGHLHPGILGQGASVGGGVIAVGCPLAVTSANLSGAPDTARIEDLDGALMARTAGVYLPDDLPPYSIASGVAEAAEAVEAGEAAEAAEGAAALMSSSARVRADVAAGTAGDSDAPSAGIASTVLDCTGDVPRVLRAGALTLEDMKGCLS